MGYDMQKRGIDNTALTKKTALVVNNLISKNRDKLLRSMPAGFNFDRMHRAVINAISTNPQLAKCDPGSIFLSCVKAFSLGLEPNGPLNEGYLVPFWNTKKGCNEAQFMPSYRGFISLARRSGQIMDIYAKAVYSNDVFSVEEGTGRKIVHQPNYFEDRGTPKCYYAVFHMINSGFDFDIMSLGEVEAIRQSSKSKDNGPWETHYEQMALKTVLKRLLKRAPMSIDFADVVEQDNKVANGESVFDAIDIEGIDLSDSETPSEVASAINADRAEEIKKKIAEKKTETQAPLPSQMEEPPDSFFENK